MERLNLRKKESKKGGADVFKGVLNLDLNEEILQEISFIYSRISKILLSLDNPKEIDEFTFEEISNIMNDNINRIEKCLDYLGRPEDESKKFEQMYFYYFGLEMDYINFMLRKPDVGDFDVVQQIQKMFDSLSYMINQLGSNAISHNSLSQLNKHFISIKNNLLSDETQANITVLQYHKLYALYQQAMTYVKETYL